MKTIVTAVVMTLVPMVVQILFRQKIIWKNYIVIFLLMLAGYLFSGKAEAASNPHADQEIYLMQMWHQLKPSEREFYENKLKMHKENAELTYNNAKERYWWLPKLS